MATQSISNTPKPLPQTHPHLVNKPPLITTNTITNNLTNTHPNSNANNFQTTEKTIEIAYLNCVGQTKFTIAKQLEIQNYICEQNLDILHLQECMIESDTFSKCGHIKSNFNIITNNTPNNTYYGTASLVRSDLEITNIHTDDQGRVIVFDAGNCTWSNLYLPSGTDANSRSLREKYSSEIIPQLLILRLAQGAAGGDLNSIIATSDCTKNPQSKMSPSFKKLVTSFAWKDSYRYLHPKTKQYSRYYTNDHHGEGASRIDRSYHWGSLEVQQAEYLSISFSDHLSHKVTYTLPSPLDRYIPPKSRPSYKIPPNVVDDKIFQTRLKKAMNGWTHAKIGADLLVWWQYLVKGGIKHLAKIRGKELKKERLGKLNILKIRQAYLANKINVEYSPLLTQLMEIKLEISQWYENESRSIILESRARDINENEKVRIYHHGLHAKFLKKSSILRLQTTSGIVEGHDACTKALEDNVADHLLTPAPLNTQAQNLLLAEVDSCFTAEDNRMLQMIPSKGEVKEVLASCRPHAAPGTDSLTAYFYQKTWNIIGDALVEVVQEVFRGAKPSPCQRTSLMVFGNKPGKKAKSLLISDRRKLSLLNVDFKIMTGIEAKRIRSTMHRTISPLQLVAGGDRRISHGVAMARDAITAAGNNKLRCGILDTDLIAAFCNMVTTWCLKVLEKKGLENTTIQRYKNLYSDNMSIIVVNNIQGRCIKNTRLSIRQGDKFAMELFSYGMDPILGYLEKRLKGILIHSIPIQGPILSHNHHQSTQIANSYPPPNISTLPNLPTMPTQIEPDQPLNSLPPLETRYILYAFCDDLKPAITNLWEFRLVERTMTIFELASGCKMHRTAESKKCKFLALGKWKTELKQNMIPHDFFSLSDHLDFLGVTLKATFTATRKINGDILQDTIRKVVGPWKGGRFMSLTLRPHSINCFAYSKLMYKCNVIDLRIADIKYFNSTAKSFIYADLLEKPTELTLYRDTKDGGLGLYHIQNRAKAALIATFLQTACNPIFLRNHYHNALYRHYVLLDQMVAPNIPPNFTGDFFPKIRQMYLTLGDIENLTIKQIYNFLMKDLLNTPSQTGTEQDNLEIDTPLIPLKCELSSPNIDWTITWRLARAPGLGPELTSFIHKVLWGIIPTKERLHKILPKQYKTPYCSLCSTTETKNIEDLNHALIQCKANQDLPQLLLYMLQTHQPQITYKKILTLDLNIETSLEFPLTWITFSLLCSIWEQREKGRVNAAKTRAELEAKCRLLREGKVRSLINAHVLVNTSLRTLFA